MPQDLQAARERMAKARAAKVAKATAAAPAPVISEPVEGDAITDLMATLQKIQDKKLKTSDLDALNEIITRIDWKNNPEVFEHPVIEALLEKIGQRQILQAQKKGLAPGSPVDPKSPTNCDAVPWHLADVNLRPDGTKELVTWTPAETLPIIYNGVMCQAIADVEMTTEKAFYDIYAEHRRLIREAELRKQWMFGKTNIAPPGEGRDGTTGAATVRAFMGMGGEGGGGRILVGYPGDARFELRDVPGAPVEGGEQPA